MGATCADCVTQNAPTLEDRQQTHPDVDIDFVLLHDRHRKSVVPRFEALLDEFGVDGGQEVRTKVAGRELVERGKTERKRAEAGRKIGKEFRESGD